MTGSIERTFEIEGVEERFSVRGGLSAQQKAGLTKRLATEAKAESLELDGDTEVVQVFERIGHKAEVTVKAKTKAAKKTADTTNAAG